MFLLTGLMFSYFISALSITDWQKYHFVKSLDAPYLLPNSRSCQCVPISQCPTLYNLLQNHPVHPLTVDFLRNQTCGYYGLDPYVCCQPNIHPPHIPHPRETKEFVTPRVINVTPKRTERCLASTQETNELSSSEAPNLESRFRPYQPNYGFGSNGFGYPGYRSRQYFPYGNFVPGKNELPNEERPKYPFVPDNNFYYPFESNPKYPNRGPSYPRGPNGPKYPSEGPKFPFDKPKYPYGFDDYPNDSSEDGMTFSSETGTEKPVVRPTVKNSGETNDIDTNKVRSRFLPDETCGLSVDERIVGGKDVKIGIYPWMARLGYTRSTASEYLYKCGGTLINTRFVITAAHCTTNLPRNLLLSTVRLGELDERTDPDCDNNQCAESPQDFVPILVIVHRDYNVPKYKNDISLLKLDKEVRINPYVSPICLPHNLMKSINYTGVQALTAGWGVVNIAGRTSSPILQHVTLQITNPQSCQDIYSTRFQLNISEEQICTMGLNGQDACEGDSGGPLMRYQLHEGVPRYFLLGVVSFGPTQCGAAGLPSVFTRIAYYLEWIIKHLEVESA